MGGFCALQVGLQNPDRVTSLVLASVGYACHRSGRRRSDVTARLWPGRALSHGEGPRPPLDVPLPAGDGGRHHGLLVVPTVAMAAHRVFSRTYGQRLPRLICWSSVAYLSAVAPPVWSPPGRAHSAFERGDLVFQYDQDVVKQQAVVVAMVGSTTTKKTTDAVDVLNPVCRQGWELISGSFVFMEEGQQSRDKFMSSGQNVAIKGTAKGYYVFKRCPENRSEA